MRLTDEQMAILIRLLTIRLGLQETVIEPPDYITINNLNPVMHPNVLPFKRKETTNNSTCS